MGGGSRFERVHVDSHSLCVGHGAATWSISVSVESIDAAMGAIAGTRWAVTASMWTAHALFGLLQPLCLLS